MNLTQIVILLIYLTTLMALVACEDGNSNVTRVYDTLDFGHFIIESECSDYESKVYIGKTE